VRAFGLKSRDAGAHTFGVDENEMIFSARATRRAQAGDHSLPVAGPDRLKLRLVTLVADNLSAIGVRTRFKETTAFRAQLVDAVIRTIRRREMDTFHKNSLPASSGAAAVAPGYAITLGRNAYVGRVAGSRCVE
jgi:hypothetical protein